MSEFDRLADGVFSTVTDLMGDKAYWLRSNDEKIEGKVLFKNPTEPINIGDSERYEYRPATATIEYLEGTFSGLKEGVDKGEQHHVIINEQEYTITEITSKFDGRVYIAHLEPYTEE